MTYSFIPGESHATSEDETLSMIRAVLTEDTTPDAVPNAARKKANRQTNSHHVAQATSVEPDASVEQDDFVEFEDPETQARNTASRGRAAFAELEACEETEPKRRKSRVTSAAARQVSKLAERLRAYRPTPRHLAIVSTLLLIVVRPHWFVFGVVLAVVVVVAAFLLLGEDRIWAAVLRRLHRIETKAPERAAELRARLDRFAYRWDSVLDYFPDGMVDGLYMPDFQTLEQAEDRHATAMSERLARMGQEG